MTQWSKATSIGGGSVSCGATTNNSSSSDNTKEIQYDYEGQGAEFWRCVKKQLDRCDLDSNSQAFMYLGAFFGVYYILTMWNAAYSIQESALGESTHTGHLIPSMQNALKNIPFRGLLPAWALDYVTVGIISSMTIFFVQCVIQPEYTCERWQIDEGVCFDETNGLECEKEETTFDENGNSIENPKWYKGQCNGLCVDKTGLGRCSSVVWSAAPSCRCCSGALHPSLALAAKGRGQEQSVADVVVHQRNDELQLLYRRKGRHGTADHGCRPQRHTNGSEIPLAVILADIIDYDEFLTGKRNEATFTMFQSFIPKMVAIPSAAIPIAIMNAFGFVQPIDGVIQPQPGRCGCLCATASFWGSGVSSLLGFFAEGAGSRSRDANMLLIISTAPPPAGVFAQRPRAERDDPPRNEPHVAEQRDLLRLPSW